MSSQRGRRLKKENKRVILRRCRGIMSPHRMKELMRLALLYISKLEWS